MEALKARLRIMESEISRRCALFAGTDGEMVERDLADLRMVSRAYGRAEAGGAKAEIEQIMNDWEARTDAMTKGRVESEFRSWQQARARG